jgi:peptidoglycan glycosyltransferase
MNRQIRRLAVALLVLYGALFVQLNVIQVVKASDYDDNPRNTRAVVRDYGRPRGQIVDAEGNVLARSVTTDNHFGRQRVYPEHDLFGSITGYFSFSHGTDGVEKDYNAELAGRSAPRSLDRLPDLLLDDTHTNDVVLTLRKSVQEAARAALGGRRGAVVVIDPRDGSVLALWSFPSFDPEPLSANDQTIARQTREAMLADPANPLLPRAFRETYFPGSTFKIVTTTAGLRSGVTADEPSYPVERQFVPPDTRSPLRNFGGSACGGKLFDILRVSCNTAFAHMGLDVGADRLIGAAHDFGFGSTPPFDLPAVAASTIEDASFFEHNRPLLAQTAIGQNTVRATPLQMALVAAGIANGGRIMAPHVLQEVRDDENRIVRTAKPSVWRTATSPEEASVIRDAMAGVVAGGTAKALAVPGIATAGKTGTAEVGNGTSHAWVIGFAPVEAPRVAVAVIVEGQPGADEATGGRVAAPIGRAVLQAALQAVPAG